MPVPAHGQLVIVANRLPVHRVRRGGKGPMRWETSPGGLVGALTPMLRERKGIWIGWSGQPGPAPPPFSHYDIMLHPVGLSRDQVERFYEGFSNQTLWPLYHDVVRRPIIQRPWWKAYREVNRRFAEAAAAVAQPKATVWVHDYQLQLVPRILRSLRPDLRIGFFLHIPFPPWELLAQLPWRGEIAAGLLGADLVGFQTEDDARNFREAARRFTGVKGRGTAMIVDRTREVTADSFPISIDVEAHEALARSAEVVDRASVIRRRVGGDRKIFLGVDRLDYTKGIDMRLLAYEELLGTGRVTIDEAVFIQVATPSREYVPSYAESRDQLEALVGRINGRFSQVGRWAVQYLRRFVDAEELAALYRAADVMVVTPFRDGMNLISKEYVASRVDGTGALVLSEFAGSARELRSAILVNPHDLDGVANGLERALRQPQADAVRRMHALRAALHRNDVHRWTSSFLGALAT